MKHLSNALKALGYNSKFVQVKFLQLYYAASSHLTDCGGCSLLTQEMAKALLQSNKIELFLNSSRVQVGFYSAKKAVEFLDNESQKLRNSLRINNIDRMHIPIPISIEKHKEEFFQYLYKLGFIPNIIPTRKHFKAILILGTADKEVYKNLSFTAKLLSRGTIVTQQIILVSGKRDLIPRDTKNILRGEQIVLEMLEERIRNQDQDRYLTHNLQTILQYKFDEFCKGINNLNDMASIVKARNEIVDYISEKYKISWPTESEMMLHFIQNNPFLSVKNYDIKVVDAPKIPVICDNGASVYYKNPDIYSTLQKTFEKFYHEIKDKHILLVSSQPSARYQEGFAREVMGRFCKIYVLAEQIDLFLNSKADVVMHGLENLLSSIHSHKKSAVAALERQERIGERNI